MTLTLAILDERSDRYLRVKDILTVNGLYYDWLSPFEINVFMSLLKQRLWDNFISQWYREIRDSSSYQIYKQFHLV